MFNRPRCCDWTPLATQQLRLRNLIQITGHNIVCKTNCSIYYTLHMTSMSSPFFTSQHADTPKSAIWPEINIQNIYEMGLRSVCVRVWQSYNDENTNRHASKDTISNEKPQNVTVTSDQLLFLWGVYFSGLIQIPNRTSVQLCENALVFQMHGGYFTSFDYILNDIIPINSPSLLQLKSDTFDTKHSKSIFRNFNNQVCDDKLVVRTSNSKSPCVSPKSGYSQINDNVILESDDIKDTLKVVFSYTNKYQKQRYIAKEFLKSEIRPSYNLQKLLKLQENQRWIRRKNEDSKDIMNKICMKSSSCLNLELIANNPLVYQQSNSSKPSGMGRTLNRLLFQQNLPPDPVTIVKAHKIREKIEIAKFRCRLLTQERDRNKVAIRKLESQLVKTSDANAELESWIMSHYRALSRERDAIVVEKIQYTGQKETFLNMLTSLKYRRVQLLKEINEIYTIKADRDNFTINGIFLPDAESYSENISSIDMSVALGYAAHLSVICSLILDVPLRNQIFHEGSRSKIADNIKILHPNNRIFPLFAKEIPPSMELFYGVYLLNQDIAQLKYSLGLSKGDLRATLPNLMHLILGPPIDLSLKNSTIESYPITKNNPSISSSSLDLDSRISIPLSKENSNYDDLNISNLKSERICRSVDNFTNKSTNVTKHQYNSEPSLSTRLFETGSK